MPAIGFSRSLLPSHWPSRVDTTALRREIGIITRTKIRGKIESRGEIWARVVKFISPIYDVCAQATSPRSVALQ